jgi:flagellar hook-associated protein 3 FlgL
MLAGLDAFNGSFLADLNNTENRISQVNKQITSDVRVNEASDDPPAIAAILGYQNQIDQTNQVVTYLNLAGTVASSADGALASASTLLDQLISIASQGASSTTTATTRSTLGQQVENIAQQLVGIANTSVQGRYIFGGDDPGTEPYTFSWSTTGGASAPGGVVQNNTAPNTATITNAAGSTIVPGQTAQQIFDARNPDGTLAAGNIFQNVYALGQALQNNDQAATQAAALSLQSSVSALGLATTNNGNTEAWIQQAKTDASGTLTNLQAELSSLRDTDVAQAATELTTDNTALQAALAAHAGLNVKSLFSYLG